eukprot:767364-Hanusia_phi.AAC.3
METLKKRLMLFSQISSALLSKEMIFACNSQVTHSFVINELLRHEITISQTGCCHHNLVVCEDEDCRSTCGEATFSASRAIFTIHEHAIKRYRHDPVVIFSTRCLPLLPDSLELMKACCHAQDTSTCNL